jgi:hypothetical protein
MRSLASDVSISRLAVRVSRTRRWAASRSCSISASIRRAVSSPVFARRRRRHVEEQCLARRLERPEPESLAHPVPGHHVAGQVGGTLEIVLGAYREEDMNPMERVLADDLARLIDRLAASIP